MLHTLKPYLLVAFFYCIACSDNKDGSVSSGLLLLGYKANPSAIVDLPVLLKTISFIKSEDKIYHFEQDKNLQFSLVEPKFLSAIRLPAGRYHSVILHFSMKDSVARVFNPSTNDWINAQMTSHDHLYIPQAKSDYFIELFLNEPFVIQADKNTLLQLSIDMKQTLTPDPDNESLIRFNPILSIENVNALPVHGHIIEYFDENNFTLLVDQQALSLYANAFYINQKQAAISDALNHLDLHDALAEMTVSNKAGSLKVVDDSLNIIRHDKYTGWLIAMQDGFRIIGHHVGADGQLTFIQEHGFDPKAVNLYREREGITPSQLIAGQSVTLYESINESSLYLEPVTVKAKVLMANENNRVQLLSVDGKRYEQFHDNTSDMPLFLYIADKDEADVITFKGYLADLKGKENYIEEQIQPSNTIDLRMDFSVNNVALLFYETFESGRSRLFFTEALDDVRIEASLSSGSSDSSLTIDEIHTTENTKFSLSYAEGDVIKQLDIQGFIQLIDTIKPLLNTHEQKLLALNVTGAVDQSQFIAEHFHVSLQYPIRNIDKNAADFWDKDIVIDLTTLHDLDRQLVNDNRAPIGVIVGATVAGVAAVAAIAGAGGLYLVNKAAYDEFSPYGVTEIYDFFGRPRITAYTDNFNDKEALQSLPSNLDTNQLIIFENGKYVVNPDTRELLPLRWDYNHRKWIKSDDDYQWNLVYDQGFFNGTKKPTSVEEKALLEKNKKNLNYKDSLRIESIGNLYRYTLSSGKTLYLMKGAYDYYEPLWVNYLNDVVTSLTGENKFYIGSNFDIKGYYSQPDNHSFLFPSRKYPFEIGDLYRPDLAKRDPSGPFKNWPVLSDAYLKEAMKFNNFNLEKKYNKTYGDERKNPDELRILIQLENDDYTINADVYNTYMRYPDHSILVQMNKDGDFRTVNGIDNINKFAETKYLNKVIWHPSGHGTEFSHGENTATQLAKNMENLMKKLPQELNQYLTSKVRLTQKHITPNHINMSGCSLGRSRWFIQSFMHRVADKFYKMTNLSPTYEAYARTSTTTKTGQDYLHPSAYTADDTPFIFKLYDGKTYNSIQEAYQKGHMMYKPGSNMAEPIPSHAEESHYKDPTGKKVRLFRGPI